MKTLMACYICGEFHSNREKNFPAIHPMKSVTKDRKARLFQVLLQLPICRKCVGKYNKEKLKQEIRQKEHLKEKEVVTNAKIREYIKA